MSFTFPKDFLFGASSSACQIESAVHEGGKGEDITDHYFSLYPERFFGGDPDRSAGFYYRYRDDVKMMKELGLKAFRFSISWSRIYPNGPDKINPEGIAYYSDLIDSLLEQDIVPFFDLYHCDMPYWIIERGNLLNPDFVTWFEQYAVTCFEAFGDRVPFWSTINEPSINCWGAYGFAATVPFLKDADKAAKASHTAILAHYAAVRAYKKMGLKGQIGSVIHVEPNYALSLDVKDQEAAERNYAFYSRWWLDPMLLGHYPEELMAYPYLTEKLPKGFREDLEKNFIPNDFIAVNYYSPGFARYKKDGQLDLEVFHDHSLPKDDYGFYSYPQGLYDTVMRLAKDYPGKDIYITENGIGVKKCGDPEKELDDGYRVDYMREHLRALSRACAAGAPVKGYFHWSIMDTNEIYAGGYNYIFGLTQVNYDTLERRPRKSWYYYQKVIERGMVD